MMIPSIVRNLCQHPISTLFNHGIFCLAVLAGMSNLSSAGQLESLSVLENDGIYETNIVAILNAPARYVYGVITDYRHIYRINPSIIETEILDGDGEGVIRVRNRLEHCIAIFCFEIDMVEDVVEIGERHLVATTVAELSSFESGNAMWHVRPFSGGRARVQYRAKIKPGFFIPPVIGSYMVKALLREEIARSLSRIECNARIIAQHDEVNIPVTVAAVEKTDEDCAG